MKNDTLSSIAASMGVSKATVSRALNHCGGVDSETRERILAAVGETTVPECAIYSLLPDTPGFFWQEMRRGLGDHADARYPMKCNVYTRLRDDFSVLSYLRESVRARVLLVAASVTPAIRETLTALLPGRLVLLLSEDDGILTNGFYLGSNAEADGYAMAEVYVRRLRDHVPYLLTLTPGVNQNVDLRAAGFSRYLRETGLPPPHRVEFPESFLTPAKTFPARMASLLTDSLSHTSDRSGEAGGPFAEVRFPVPSFPANPFSEDSSATTAAHPYALYAAFGYAHLPGAIEKVRLWDQTRLRDHCALLCHDVPLVDGKLPDGVFAACNQDVYAEGKRAMEIAHHYLTHSQYPAQKRIYIPTTIVERDEPASSSAARPWQ